MRNGIVSFASQSGLTVKRNPGYNVCSAKNGYMNIVLETNVTITHATTVHQMTLTISNDAFEFESL